MEKAVLTVIQVQIALADNLPGEIELTNSTPVVNRENKQLANSLKQAEKQHKQYSDASDGLYMDWKNGDITKTEYHRLKTQMIDQIQRLEQNISYLKEEIRVLDDGADAEVPYLADFLQHRNIRTLNRGILVELVDTVWVHEKGEITVDFNFADPCKNSGIY